MSSLSVAGAVLDFDVTAGTVGDGRAVVQLHGLTSSRERDRLLGLDLCRGLPLEGPDAPRVLRYDARGHGLSTGSDQPEDYRWDRLAEDLITLLDHVFPGEQPCGVGPSMGTGTLLHALVSEPERFCAVTIVAPPTAWETRRSQASTYESQARFIERAGVEAFVEAGRLAPRPAAVADQPDTVPAVVESLLPTVLRGAALADLPTRRDLAGLETRALILAWTDDATHPLSSAAILHGLLMNSRVVVAETPAEVAAWPELFAAQVAGCASGPTRELPPSA